MEAMYVLAQLFIVIIWVCACCFSVHVLVCASACTHFYIIVCLQAFACVCMHWWSRENGAIATCNMLSHLSSYQVFSNTVWYPLNVSKQNIVFFLKASFLFPPYLYFRKSDLQQSTAVLHSIRCASFLISIGDLVSDRIVGYSVGVEL